MIHEESDDRYQDQMIDKNSGYTNFQGKMMREDGMIRGINIIIARAISGKSNDIYFHNSLSFPIKNHRQNRII